MNCVYILQSQKNGRYYVGSANDLERRLTEHNSGKTSSLKYLRPLITVFVKEYVTLEEARRIELKLKKAKSRVLLERIISDQEIQMGL